MQRTVPVSVIIPNFNSGATLKKSIASINPEGGGAPEEIIIIDDHSTDDSLAVIEELVRQHSNLRAIKRNKNGGAAEARRDGILSARCDHIAILDADDYLEDGALSDAYQTLTNASADVCMFQCWRSEDGRESQFVNLSAIAFPLSGREAANLTLGGWRVHGLVFAKRSVYVKAYSDFVSISFNSDELITRLAFIHARKVVACSKRYFYTLNTESTTQTFKPSQLSELDANIWLIDFSNTYRLGKTVLLSRMAINSAWKIYRSRKKYGKDITKRKIAWFTKRLFSTRDVFPKLLLHPKALTKLGFLSLVGRGCSGNDANGDSY
jgi:glycosyltransferase involved in cell wall biosynthesis